MRFAKILFGATAMLAAAGCGGNPEGQGDEGAQQVQSTLEATGKVDFWVEVKGQHTGQFKGETNDTRHANQFAAFRFHSTVTEPTSAATGQPSGRTQFDGVTITKAFGASDPQFINSAATAESLSVKMHFVATRPDGSVKEYQTVTLTNALATKVERSTIVLDDAAKTNMFADEITFTFQKMELEDEDGHTDTVVGPSLNAN